MDLALTAGVTCLVGPNGAGKSTLLGILGGMQRPPEGVVVRRRGTRVGQLPQQLALPMHARCADYVEHAAWVHGVPRAARPVAVRVALEEVGLAERSRDRVRTLSGGMQRRLGIAQAIVHRPDVVLLDEPTAGLDPLQRASLRDVLARMAVRASVLVSTHLVEDVRGLADRVVVLSDGAVVFDGTVPELEALDRPSAPGASPLERSFSALMQGAQS
ncbi:ABC transporter ATP-binding protein [Demequina sp.]|uniref:ABC transporter ATP-binding protein n=1 Tax=Demequina sp. TaxID=2050685 RepID=UPI003A86A7A7